MSTALEAPKTAMTAPGPAARPPAPLGRPEAPALARRLAARLGKEWAPRAAWTISRTGRAGLAGFGLLLAAAMFFVSTHLKVVAEVESLRAEVAAAQRQARTAAPEKVPAPLAALRGLPTRAEMPALLHQLFDEATQARLAVDTARYEIKVMGSGGVVRHQIAFPVTGPYPQIRAFLDSVLTTMPAVALSDLAIERKSIGDDEVEAQIRMTLYTRSAP